MGKKGTDVNLVNLVKPLSVSDIFNNGNSCWIRFDLANMARHLVSILALLMATSLSSSANILKVCTLGARPQAYPVMKGVLFAILPETAASRGINPTLCLHSSFIIVSLDLSTYAQSTSLHVLMKVRAP